MTVGDVGEAGRRGVVLVGEEAEVVAELDDDGTFGDPLLSAEVVA